MLGNLDEYTIIDLAPISIIASGGAGTSALSASAVDVRELTGIGWLHFVAASCVSAASVTVVLQYMDTSLYPSILSIAQADASGTWAATTTQPFTMISALTLTSQVASINWDMVEGQYIRLLITNSQTNGSFTCRGVAIGRQQDTP